MDLLDTFENRNFFSRLFFLSFFTFFEFVVYFDACFRWNECSEAAIADGDEKKHECHARSPKTGPAGGPPPAAPKSSSSGFPSQFTPWSSRSGVWISMAVKFRVRMAVRISWIREEKIMKKQSRFLANKIKLCFSNWKKFIFVLDKIRRPYCQWHQRVRKYANVEMKLIWFFKVCSFRRYFEKRNSSDDYCSVHNGNFIKYVMSSKKEEKWYLKAEKSFCMFLEKLSFDKAGNWQRLKRLLAAVCVLGLGF